MLYFLKPIPFYVVLNLYVSFKSEWAPVQELTILKVLMIYENNTHLKYMYGFTVYIQMEKKKNTNYEICMHIYWTDCEAS